MSKHTVTVAEEVPSPGSEQASALESLGLGDVHATGFLVGYAAGLAANKLPVGARAVRVVVVAEIDQ